MVYDRQGQQALHSNSPFVSKSFWLKTLMTTNRGKTVMLLWQGSIVETDYGLGRVFGPYLIGKSLGPFTNLIFGLWSFIRHLYSRLRLNFIFGTHGQSHWCSTNTDISYQPWKWNWKVVVWPMGIFGKWLKLALGRSITNQAKKNAWWCQCAVSCVHK